MPRIAIVSDLHGNLSAFEAVLADLRSAAPDLVLHGGDLADPGSSPVEVIDQIRDLGWSGVYGNTDEMLVDPASFDRFADGVAAQDLGLAGGQKRQHAVDDLGNRNVVPKEGHGPQPG